MCRLIDPDRLNRPDTEFLSLTDFYLVAIELFVNFAIAMVALPSWSGGSKEHQKGMRCDSSTVPAAVIPRPVFAGKVFRNRPLV